MPEPEKLMPCPKCRSTDVFMDMCSPDTLNLGYMPCCKCCGIKGAIHDRRADALADWNTRQPPLPCPHCGAHLVKLKSGDYAHPHNHCIWPDGAVIQSCKLHLWNRRLS